MIIGINATFACFETWRMLPRLLEPMIVKIPFVSWIPRLPSSALPIFFAAWLLAALLFIVGWKTRVAGAVLALATGYTLVLDQQTYSNHLYLLFLITLLLTIAESGATWSLDAWRRGSKSDVAFWPILLLKTQITIVYFFSAAAKITPHYLAGEILAASLKPGGLLAVPQAWRTPAFLSALAVISILMELFIAFGLWSRRLRLFALIAGVGFHLSILAIVGSSRLSLAIFALGVFAVYPLFIDEGQLQRWHWLLRDKTTRTR
ncbi:MAG TPA: HTTM domain-containing protein [Thermoanaerobaculia bacterium]|nr:HTTM domain-containing protein [Thermoanaerobaculia bacterium]